MSRLEREIALSGPPTTWGDSIAKEGWYQIPEGPLTKADVNRAREALATLQVGCPAGCWVNVPLAEAEGLAGQAGPAFRAIWLALAKADRVAQDTGEDSSLAEFMRAL